MERRHHRRLVLVGIPLAAAIVAACSFPYVTFEPAPESPAVEQKESLCPVCQDAGSPEEEDVFVPPPPHQRYDAGDCDGHPQCDCDDDGFASLSCPLPLPMAGPNHAKRLTPGDCDDLDNYVHPGQGFVAVPAVPGRPSDWNCDGVEEHDPPQNIVCGGTGALGCTGGRGFLGAPPCGAEADLFECKQQPDPKKPCVAVLVGRAIQACR